MWQCVPLTQVQESTIPILTILRSPCQHAQLHDVTFGNGDAGLTVTRQAFAGQMGFWNSIA
jgi:hypothetical protein